MHTVTTAEQRIWTSKHSEKSEGFTERLCRSAVCGGDVFIPNSELDGASLDFSCDVNHT